MMGLLSTQSKFPLLHFDDHSISTHVLGLLLSFLVPILFAYFIDSPSYSLCTFLHSSIAVLGSFYPKGLPIEKLRNSEKAFITKEKLNL